MSESQEPIGYDDAHRHADTVFQRDLWDAAESALEAITPALWDMALAAGALLDVKPDVRHPHPRRALRKPQPEGEVAVVLRIDGRTNAGPVTMADLHCRVGRQWSFSPRSFGRTRTPVWKDLASYRLDELSAAPPHLVENLRAVVAAGIRTRSREGPPAVTTDGQRLKRALNYLWAPFANLLWYVQTMVMGTLSLLLWPFDRTGNLQHWCVRWWCRLIAWTIFARIRVHGAENLRPDLTYVYMANHASLIDTPALFAYLPHQFRIMAKKELFWVPFLGWHLWTAGHFPIDRGDGRRTARSIRKVIDGVHNGKSLAVFPEGTRSRNGRLQEFKPGAFKIALRAGVPIVPVTIRGTFKLLPKTTLAPTPGCVDVIVGMPIDTKEYSERTLHALMDRTKQTIQANLTDDTAAAAR